MRSGDLYSGLTSLHTGRRVLEKGHLFVGNFNNIEEPHTLGDGVFPLGKDNIWVGDQNCVAQESDKFKEMISKIITLRYELGLIEQNTTFILQSPSPLLSKAQALNSLPDGILTHKKGVVDSAALGAALFPFPSSSLPPIAIPNPTFDPFSGFDWLMSGPWLPQIMAGNANTLNTQSETVISSSLAMTQIKTAQAIKRLDYGSFVVKSRSMDFTWENRALALVPDVIKTLYGLDAAYSFTNAIALDEIGSGLLANDSQGNLTPASLSQGKVWIGDSQNKPIEINLDIAPPSAQYILKTANSQLPNAQALDQLDGWFFPKLLKAAPDGTIEVADSTDDYVTPTKLKFEVELLEKELALSVATLTGYGTLAALIDFLASIGFTYAWDEYLFRVKYQPLRTRNKYSDTDDTTGWAGNMWYDANHIGNAGDFEPGIRVTSWDSSHILDSDLFPVSMGLFGYRNQLGYVNRQRGFCFRSEMENDSDSSLYRWPKNFGLFEVAHDDGQIGWNAKKDVLLLYEKSTDEFAVHKNFNFLNISTIKGIPNPQQDSDAANKSYVDSSVSQKILTLAGAVAGEGYLNDPIMTTFEDDPVFTGGSITIPATNIDVVPTHAGMIRYKI